VGSGPNSAWADEPPPLVVVLNSYHQGEDWSDNELAGLLPGLENYHRFLAPAVEHLDAKRFPGPEHLSRLETFLIDKYRGRHVDLVMALDNPALDLLVSRADRLFPGLPVVFAGINGWEPDMIKNRPQTTGVAEVQDLEGAIRLARSLIPDLKTVLAIHDHTSSGLAVRREAEIVRERLKGSIQIEFTPPEPFHDLEKRLNALGPQTAAVIMTYVTDAAGRTFTREESTRLITSASPRPVFAMHETRLGYGIVGGLLLEGREHGRRASEIAVRVLKGENPSAIPVAGERSRPVFDYSALVRFHIDPGAAPADSVFINRPVSPWREHRDVLVPALVVTVFLALLTALLGCSVVRLRKTRAALRVNREDYRRLVDNLHEGIWEIDPDGRTRFVNPRLAEMLGYSVDEMKDRSVYDFLDEPDRAAAGLLLGDNEPGREAVELRFLRRDGSSRYASLEISPIWDDQGARRGTLAAVADVTHRVQARKNLEMALKEKETLLQEVHHRVRNNMQIISSLLRLQNNAAKDEHVRAILMESEARVYAMASVHETLYRSESFAQVDLSVYVTRLTDFLGAAFGGNGDKVRIEHAIEDILLNLDQASPIGLILNELVTNALKYAFPDGRTGRVRVTAEEENGLVRMMVSDDGVGLPAGLDWTRTSTLGLRIVKILAEDQLGGRLDVQSANGTTFVIQFRKKDG
jgi:PAS domain S-box-containing protein